MRSGRKISRFGRLRLVSKLVTSSAKIFLVALLFVLLWKIFFILRETNYYGESRRLRSFQNLQEIQKMLDVTLGNAQIWSSNLTEGAAVMSLYKGDIQIPSISIMTTIVVNNSHAAKVWKRGDKLVIRSKPSTLKLISFHLKNMACLNVIEESEDKGYSPSHNIDVNDASYYGGAEMHVQKWPLNLGEVVLSPFVLSDVKSDGNKAFGPVMERYWLTSEGAAIFVDHVTPLHVGYGQSAIRLKAVHSPEYKRSNLTLKLNYTVCIGKNIKSTHINMIGRLWDLPVDVPDILTLNHPVWSTKVRYAKGVNQADVLNLVKEILSHNLTISQLELHEVFSAKYGDWKWDETKFPDVTSMINEIHKRVTYVNVLIAPFINKDAELYDIAEKLRVFIKSGDYKTAKIKWSQGVGGHIDFTNKAASQYFTDSLSKPKVMGVDAFVMDGGFLNNLPSNFITHQNLAVPMQFCTHQVKNLRKSTNNKLMVRCGYQTQSLDVYIQMLPKESTWDVEGLGSIIPSVLQYSIMGYIFFIPDVIGGNGFAKDEGTIVSGRLPDRELFLRWCQLVAFLPVMHFSVTPWDYDEETVTIVQKFVKLHDEYITPKVIPLSHDAIQNGYPIIRPLWWVDPNDHKTFNIDSQFLIGDEVLVAPILQKDTTIRNIYLPKGQWRDMNYNKILQGPLNVYNYLAPLENIPYFERIK